MAKKPAKKKTKAAEVLALIPTTQFSDRRFLHDCPRATLSTGFWNGAVSDGVCCGTNQLATIAGTSLFLWNAQTGELLERRDTSSLSLRVSPAGDVIAVGPDSCVGGTFDVDLFRIGQRFEPLAKLTLPLSSATAYSLDFAIRGAELVVADSNQAWTFDVATSRVLHHFASPLAPEQSNGVAISPDGERVVFGQWKTNEVSVHSARDGRSLCRFVGEALHTGQGVVLAITSDSKRLLSAGSGAVRLWSLEDGQLLRSLPLPSGSRDVLSLHLLADDRVVVRCPGVQLICWDLSKADATWVQSDQRLGAVPVPLAAGATQAAYGMGARLYRMHLETGERLGTFAGVDGPPKTVHLDQSAKTLCASGGGTTRFFDTATAEVRHHHLADTASPGAKSAVLFQTLSGFGTNVFVTRADGANALPIASGAFAAAVALGDGVAIADGHFSSEKKKAVRIWSHAGKLETTILCSPVERLLAFPDGRTLIVSRKGEFEILDADAGKSVATIKKAHARAISVLAAHDELFATASTNVLKVWALPGTLRFELKLAEVIRGLAFIDDERLLVTLSSGELLVLDTAKGKEQAQFSVGKNVECSSLHPNGTLAVGFSDLDLALFQIPT